MIVGSCSTTITVFPAFAQTRSTASSRSLSRAVQPTVGSSITYIVSVTSCPARGQVDALRFPPESGASGVDVRLREAHLV